MLSNTELIRNANRFSKKTKIVATIGPATESIEMLSSLADQGMNVVRLNFSHGSYEEHKKRIDNTREISRRIQEPIAVLQDLCGPKIRIGILEGEKCQLKKDNNFVLTVEECLGNEKKAFVSYSKLNLEVKPGSIIMLRDGRVKLEVKYILDKEIHCTVLVGGEIKSKAGVNAPGAYLSIPCLTEKDKRDIEFGIENKADFMAISFVRKSSDIAELKNILKGKKADIGIIAKVETQEAIDNIDSIINEADGIMVARGDLATEVPAEQVPLLQKMIIRKCNKLGKPVIVATQMLESMISSPVPTRAEVNDIANAILDGTDAIMLSEETTLGKYPLEAVKMMSDVAKHTEQAFPHEEALKKEHLSGKESTDSVSYAAVNMARELNAKAIIALTVSGFTARMVARHKPSCPIIAITPDMNTYIRLALKFNCYPIFTEMFDGLTKTIEVSKEKAMQSGLLKKEDNLIIVAGIPFSKKGNTNLVLVQKID